MLRIPEKSLNLLNNFLFDTKNKTLVYKYVVKQLNRAIKNNEPKAELFSFEGSTLVVWISKDKYIESLNVALSYFIKEEEYECAAVTKKIINNYLINTVISESNNKEG
jgi:protein-arginine kinase activator protein McsA